MEASGGNIFTLKSNLTTYSFFKIILVSIVITLMITIAVLALSYMLMLLGHIHPYVAVASVIAILLLSLAGGVATYYYTWDYIYEMGMNKE